MRRARPAGRTVCRSPRPLRTPRTTAARSPPTFPSLHPGDLPACGQPQKACIAPMTTAPYAKLRANIAGAGNLSGALVGAPGAVCQLSQDPAGLGSSFLYQIVDYPEGWTVPAGWSADAFGVYFYQGLTPPSFTLPALPLWGKLIFSLTVNNGDPGTSGLDPTQFIDTATSVGTLDPNGNVEDIAYREGNQWDSQRKWMGPMKRNLRTLAAYAANIGFDLAT